MRVFRRLVPWLALPLLAIGGWQAGHGAFLHGKAWLAQELLRDAWARSRGDAPPARPWPWADTWPVARIEVARLGVDEIVLAGGSGRTLAFGPGHVDGTAAPGQPGNSVIGGHRDTHFRFLRDLVPGDTVVVTTVERRRIAYRVVDRQVVRDGAAGIRLDVDGTWLTLATCYPFDSLVPGGPLRYVVTARAMDPALAEAPAVNDF
ncbi:MAG TPA: class GN sortase [Alphaproteobacteria bacterium]|jgi:sortase A